MKITNYNIMKKYIYTQKLLQIFALLDLNNYLTYSIFRIIQTQFRILLNKNINK